jgi:hypothetical protein
MSGAFEVRATLLATDGGEPRRVDRGSESQSPFTYTIARIGEQIKND